jgi:hypothetical protein
VNTFPRTLTFGNRGLDRRNDDGGSEEFVLQTNLPQALCEM